MTNAGSYIVFVGTLVGDGTEAFVAPAPALTLGGGVVAAAAVVESSLSEVSAGVVVGIKDDDVSVVLDTAAVVRDEEEDPAAPEGEDVALGCLLQHLGGYELGL